jgi:arginyl-tRNA synthetase
MADMEDVIAGALSEHLPLSRSDIAGLLQTPPSPEMGDYGLPCFVLSKYLRKAPDRIAQELADAVELPAGVREARPEGAYLNFFVDRAELTARVLDLVRRRGERYGSAETGSGKTIVIDYGSPNIAKHLGIHHLPSAVVGQALYRLYENLGYDCTGINHLGDWGTSFGRLIAAVERYGIAEPERLTVADMQRLYVRYSKEASRDPERQQAARDAFRRLEEGEPRAVEIWSAFKQVSLEEFDLIYGRLGVSFDRVTPESFYNERLKEAVERMRRDGVAQESEGALIIPLYEEGLPPCLVQKSDGASLYAARDIPAAEHRWEEFRFEQALYVVGNEQSLHFRQLKGALKRMGHEWADRIVHVNFGLIKFRDPATGKARVGSTRRGEMLLLKDVLDEAEARARSKIEENAERLDPEADLDELAAQVGIGAVVFRQLSTRRTRDVVFDWDRMLDFEGDTGPYVQYAHARLCSILRKAGKEAGDAVDYSLLSAPEEWVLVRHLERFPQSLRRAAAEYEPSVVATYLLELCADFSTYYSAGMREPERRVLCDDRRLREARLALVEATRHVIRNGLALLGIAAPDRM